MSSYEKWNIITNSLIAIGTLGAIFVALFGTRIRNWIFKPKLTVEILDKNGDLTFFKEKKTRVIYYHLKITNEKPSITIKNCSIYLKAILKLQDDNTFCNLPLAVPPRFCWAPATTSLDKLDIVTAQVLDFGFVIENDIRFNPAVTPIFNNFKGFLTSNETYRYQLEIIADNYRPKELLTIEVSWNGKWSDDPIVMEQNLMIKKI